LSAERALKIDPNHARAMSGLGWNAMYREWDFAKAAQLIRRARELEPGNASVLNANAVLMGVFGRRDQMISLYEDALERDPVAMSVLSNLTGAYFNNENTKNSAALVERMRAIEPNSEWVVAFDAWLTWRNGDAEAALDMFTNVGGSMGSWGKPFALYDLGRDDEIDEAIQALEAAGGRPTQVAGIYAYMSEHDKSFAALERAYEQRDDWLIEIRMFGFFEPLHDDPRWEALLQRIGISDTDAEKISL
jgi:tetratricopeptide (TPR) repeat protein